jgi:phenylpropionate dioxygenase-like ring-hydroxylating dioxygenase large terminal subunit
MAPVAAVEMSVFLPICEFPAGKNHRTLPSSFFTSEEVYQLERRAIFSKSWLAVCHMSRLNVGVLLRDEVAGFKLSVVLDKDGKVSAFRGHDELVEPIHTYITVPGDFIFVNLDPSPAVKPFEDSFPGLLEVLKEFDFGGFTYHTEYAWNGDFNWKTFVDGFQECLHCKGTHASLARDYKMDSYKVTCHDGWARHSVERKDSPASLKAEQPSSGTADGAWLFILPNLMLNIYSASISIQRVIPQNAVETKMDIRFYRRNGVSDAEINDYAEFAKVVDREDFELVSAAQANLNQGIYSRGILHPYREAGVIYYQGEVRKRLQAHAELEKAEGKEVWPAGRQ